MHLTLYINHIIYLIVNVQNICFCMILKNTILDNRFLIKNIQTKKKHLNAVVGKIETY